ncbi:hypothetical protein Patl1_14146 [Pistacia atlantica]|uniref:Uncharacterized protein n=1 Tax=Pistacia atlantica TaxID=434234 RepID=A0ACC1AUI9_9ROSI|nr:hypothetical protein Patl1_14146 [Pistacia atlantica]
MTMLIIQGSLVGHSWLLMWRVLRNFSKKPLKIGGYYGSGRRGGEVAQFLVALAERPAPNTYPRRFISFCRVGTGLSDDELDTVVTKLKPYFRKYEYPKRAPPGFYEVTNNSKERPDVWIESPEKSIILSITSDIRTIRSEVFAAPYSLRFPRIDRVRYDKPWHECLDVQSFVELVHSSNGTTQKEKDYGAPLDYKPKRAKSSKLGDRKNVSVVPFHFIQTDVSNIKGETLIFSNMVFYFVNVPPTLSLDSLHKMVVENGGTFSMNLNKSVTHCVAAENRGIKYQAAKLRGDVIHYSWVLDCCSQKKLLHLQPRYFLNLSDSSKTKLQEEVDEFSDSFYWDLDLADLRQLLSNIHRLEDPTTVEYYRKKYCPEDKWSCFHGCCIYFYPLTESLKPDGEVLLELALRRMKLEVSFGGGKVCNNLVNATHLVILSVPGTDMNFDSLIKGYSSLFVLLHTEEFASSLYSFTTTEKYLFGNKKLHVVGSQWLEDCLKSERKLEEDTYSLKPSGIEESDSELCKRDLDMKEVSSELEILESQNIPSSLGREGKQRGSKVASESSRLLSLPKREGIRKRGRPAGGSTKKGKMIVTPARRTRARVGKMPSKIYENESDRSDTSSEKEIEEDTEMNEENHGMVGTEKLQTLKTEVLEESEPSHRGKATEQQVVEDVRKVDKSVQAPDIEMVETNYGQDSEKPETLEVMVDPVQAMLLDMIPSLGAKKVETTSDPIREDEKPSADACAGPTKKKKVSYKDVASELLKDW